MKRLLLLFLLAASATFAQVGGQNVATLSNPYGGNLSAAGANCGGALVCAWQKLPSTAQTTTVTITGTFSATLIIEYSADNGNTFTQQSSQTAPTVVTFATVSYTDVRVRCSAYTSGVASVNIQTAGNQQNITINSAGGGVTTGLSYSNITTNANTQVFSGSGMLGAIQINNPGSGWSAQIFDNTSCSGATIATTSSLSGLSGSTLNYYVTFNTGLCVKTTGTTPGDLTVTYSNAAGTFSYSNITASTNTQIKSGNGTLQWIQVNNPGSGWSATIYDNTSCSGTKIATITSFSGLPVAFLKYTLKFNTGCCIATTGATPGDLTVARI